MRNEKFEQGQFNTTSSPASRASQLVSKSASQKTVKPQPASNPPLITTPRQLSKPTIQQTSPPKPANRKPAPAIIQSFNQPPSQLSRGHRSHRTTNPPPSKGRQSREGGLFKDHEAKCTRRNRTNSMYIRVAGRLLAGNQEASPWSLRRLGSPV